MAIIGLFQCDPWCLPTQKWLKNATNDISIQEFHNIITHYKPHYQHPLIKSITYDRPMLCKGPSIEDVSCKGWGEGGIPQRFDEYINFVRIDYKVRKADQTNRNYIWPRILWMVSHLVLYCSVPPKTLFWFRSNTKTETQNGRYRN